MSFVAPSRALRFIPFFPLTLFYFVLFFALFSHPVLAEEFGLPQMQGAIEGEGVHFEIADSAYLNISLDSTEAIKIRMESVPEMVTMMIEPVSSAISTLDMVYYF